MTDKGRLGGRCVGAIGVALALLVTATPAGATADFSFERIAGDSRYATAAQLALENFPSTTGAIIATGEAFPDALAASFIAGYVNSPILLVERTRVPEATSTALAKLGVREVVLLGGTAAISQEVEDDFKRSYEVVRLFGPDRFATAANIALAVNPADIGELDGKRTAFLTYGYTFADAISIGPLANSGRFPVLLNGSAGLGSPARVALERLEIGHVLLVGGPAAISDAARAEVEAMGITTERLQGADRFATATEVADFAKERLGFVADHVNLAMGVDPSSPARGFADALAGSVHAGKAQAPLLLTHPTALSTATHAWLEANARELLHGDVIGGEGAVSKEVVATATEAARNLAGEVLDVTPGANEYEYRRDGDGQHFVIAYASGDRFSINGADATLEEFEDALTVGDRVRVTRAGGTWHRLTQLT